MRSDFVFKKKKLFYILREKFKPDQIPIYIIENTLHTQKAFLEKRTQAVKFYSRFCKVVMHFAMLLLLFCAILSIL